MTNEPDDMARARRLLEEFERAGGLSKQDCFEEAIILLRDFSTEHPNSEFSEIVNNLRYTYTKILIEKLSSVSFSNYADWFATWEWTRRFSEEIEKVKRALEEKGLKIESASIGWVAKENIAISETDKKACEKLFEALDGSDDVQEIYSNFKE